MKKTVVASGSEAYMDPTGLHGTLIASRRLQQRRKKTRWNRSGGIMHLAIDTLRNDTPGCQHVLHFNNAGASLSPMPIDVKKIGCDFLCATGRKFLRGPRGTGFLYARKDIISHYDPPFIDLHAAQWSADNEYILHPDARRFETWEQNIAAKIGLGVAIDYALALGMPAIWARVQHLATLLRQQLAEVPSLQLHDLGIKKCGIVTFSSQKKSVQAIRQHLADKQINVSISRQEYARLDLVRRNLPAVIRASVHYYNTEEEIYTFCKEMDIFLNQR